MKSINADNNNNNIITALNHNIS